MKLWLLQTRDDLGNAPTSNPWEPWYDKAFGFVVRAETEEAARQLAAEEGGDEVSFSAYYNSGTPDAWLSSKYSTCVELTADGQPSVILRDYARA